MRMRSRTAKLLSYCLIGFVCLCLYFISDVTTVIRNQPRHLTPAMFARSYPNVTASEIERFFAAKEKQYHTRRMDIKHICETMDLGFDNNLVLKRSNIVYDAQDKVSYCMIPKVASSTWCNHFIDLGNPPEEVRKKFEMGLQILAKDLFPKPPLEELVSSVDQTVSIAIVRHPFARLASVYYQKFVDLGAWYKAWVEANQRIIELYRIDKSNPSNISTPDEFIRFVTDNNKEKKGWVDQHWKAQSMHCPFCNLNFTVYARMEELNEDTLYFALKSKLENRLNLPQAKNPTSKSEYEFWSQVQVSSIVDVIEPYRTDMMMFGYSAKQYLRDLGVNVDEAQISL